MGPVHYDAALPPGVVVLPRLAALSLLVACADEEVPERARLAFPLADRDLVSGVVGVDHDPAVHEGLAARALCLDHRGRGFPHCYDEHDGTDFLLEGGFETMDAGSVAVVAAAPGRVVLARDGHYDRCHATVDGVSCDGHDGIANAVRVAHPSGLVTSYWHLRQGSVAVAEGDEVARGEVLGLVGSSGYSSMPHLHFEVALADGAVIDPYAGDLSQAASLWCVQDAGDGLPGPCAP